MRIFGFVILSIGAFAFECSESKETDIQFSSPPSSIYANNDTTLLGTFSPNGYKIAPYFCESLREEVKMILNRKDAKGQFICQKKDGTKYDLYKDELKIYTSLDPTLQVHAETALKRHLSEDLQPAFSKNNESVKNFPFSDTYNGQKVTGSTIENIMRRARRSSQRYTDMLAYGHSEDEIDASFNVPSNMRVFSWNGEIDTVMTPNDSIRHYKNFIRSGLVSIEPSTGFVKAWVGGIDYEHFTFDHVKQGKRQIGSCIKPFTYATAFSMGVAEPCMVLDKEDYCVEPCDPSGRRWCPAGTPLRTVTSNFATNSSGGTSIPIISLMGACSGPITIAKLLKRMDIIVPEDEIVPSMALGTTDMSLLQITSAYAMFANNGVYITPRMIRRIEDKNGKVIYSSEAKSREVIFPTIAYDLVQMMEIVVSSGMATSLRTGQKWGGITHPTAGMTGTTQGNADMWFVGMTPDLVTGVWTGGEDKQVRFRSMLWGQGARASLPIYGYYMQQVYADSTLNISTEGFKAPEHYPPGRFDCESDSKKTETETNQSPFK